MMVLREVILGVRGHLAHRFSEWVISSALLLAASSLLSNVDLFATSSAYDYMASLASQHVWGWTMFFIAMFRFIALGVNGSVRWFRPYSPMIRSTMGWASSAVWAILSLSLFHSYAIGPTWRIALVLAGADLWLAWTIAREAGAAYTRHTNGNS